MNEPPRKRRTNWGTLISFLIFLIIGIGRPLINLIGQATGLNVSALLGYLPLLIAGFVVLSITVSAVRAVGASARRRSDSRLPTEIDAQTVSSMPPAPTNYRPPTAPASYAPASQQLPGAPRFEPLINPAVLVVAVLGLLGLVGAGAFLLLQANP